jgi:predicted RND superfamily exporter protein
LARLQIDTSTDSVLDRNDAAWQTYQQSQKLFGGDEFLVVAFTGSTPFDPEVLSKVERLSALATNLEGVRRVDSLSTVPVIRLDAAGDLDLRAALEEGPTDPAARSLHVEALLRGDRIAPRSLVSDDGRTFAVNLVLYRGVEAKHAELITQLHQIVDPMGGVISGVPVFRVAANESTRAEILAFAPLTAGLIAAFLWFVFRSLKIMLIGLAPGVAGSYLTVATMGFLGAPLSITTMILPSIILAVGCTFSMHLIAAAKDNEDARTPEALKTAFDLVALPVALSGLTTVVGLASMTVVEIEAVRDTGGYGALGVFVVTAMSLTLLPAALTWHRVPAAAPRGFVWVRTKIAPRLIASIARRSGVIISAWLIATTFVGAGVFRIEVETDATRWLPPGNSVRDSYESIRASLSGISPMNVVVHAPEGRSVLDSELLSAIDSLSRHLESFAEVGKTLSIADPLRQIHGAMLGESTQPLPENVISAEQYMLLLESVEPIHDLISSDRRTANIMIRANDNGSARLARIATEVDTWWKQNGPHSSEATTTGIMYEFARAEDEIAYGQLRGLTVALGVIGAVLFAIFRWPRLALVALVPNALPLALIFGLLGLLDIPLDAGTVLIGGLAIGIAVDDTIHISTRFYDHLSSGDSSTSALGKTFEEVLPAILSTTAMISVAFFILGFSDFTITRNLGLLTGGIMLICLLADITLLPALLLKMPRRTFGGISHR